MPSAKPGDQLFLNADRGAQRWKNTVWININTTHAASRFLNLDLQMNDCPPLLPPVHTTGDQQARRSRASPLP